MLLVVLFSWFAFDEIETVTASQLAGLVLIGMSIYLFRVGDTDALKQGTGKQKGAATGRTKRRTGIFDLAMATIVTAGIALLAKYAVGASHTTNIGMFMFFSNCASAMAGFSIVQRRLRRKRREAPVETQPTEKKLQLRRCVLWGLVLGVINLVSYACLLQALSLSSASVVIPMHSLYIIVPLLLSAVIDGTKITDRTTVAVVLAILSVMILKA